MNEPKIKTAELLNVPPAQCVPAPGFNRSDLNLTPEFLADIKKRGVRQSLEVRRADPARFLVEPGKTNGKKAWFVLDLTTKQRDGTYDSFWSYADEPTARQNVPRFEIIAGQRRWAAAMQEKLATIPVGVVTASDQELREARLIENLQRENLTALDEAVQMAEALSTGSYGAGSKGVEALAVKLGKSRSYVYARLRLNQLTPPVLEAMKAGKIPASVAELLATLPGHDLQQKALKRVLENGPYSIDSDDEWADEQEDRKAGKRSKEQWKAIEEARSAAAREPMSYRAVKAMLNDQFRLDLTEKARWKLDDAKLLPEAGACATCPKRSGTVPGAFPEIKNPNLCTDPDCFAAKRALADAAALKPYADKGNQVMTPQEHQKAFAGSYSVGGGWMEGSEYVYGLKDGYGKAARELLGKAMPEPTYAVNRQGQVRAFYKKSEVMAMARAKGLLKPEQRDDKPPAKETPEAKAKREQAEAAQKLETQIEAETLSAAVTETLKPVESLKDFGTWAAPLFRLLFSRLDESDFVNHELLVRRRGWKGGHVQDHAEKLSGAQMLALLVEVFLIGDVYSDEYDKELLKKIAAAIGVKLEWKALEKEVRARLTPEQKAPVKEAKPAKAVKPKTKTKK